MGLLKRDRPRANLERIRRTGTHDLVAYVGTSLNEIGRLVEAEEFGPALDQATLLREVLIEIDSRAD